MHNEPLAELEARKLFPEAIQAYLTPVQPLYDADFSWKYNGPFPSPETMANVSLFSGEYFRLDDDCFDMRPGYGVAQPGSFWLKLYGFRWCTLLLSVVAIVYVLAPRIHILDKGQMALNIIFFISMLEGVICMNISGRVLGTAPRIRFCRGTQTVFMMTREGIVKKGHWENISFVISKILLGKHPCYKLFMSIDGTLSDDSCIPVLVSYMGDDDQYQIRFLQSFYEFICHYMEYGSQYIKRNPLSYSHQNDGFWSRPRLGIVLLPPFPYPEAYQLKESDIHIGLRFLSYYLWFQFLPISVNNEVKNFKEFPKEMERL